jgi:hypothetical protein
MVDRSEAIVQDRWPPLVRVDLDRESQKVMGGRCADNKSAHSKRPEGKAVENQSACASVYIQFVKAAAHLSTQGFAPKTGCMHSGSDANTKETKLGSAEGGTRSLNQWHRGYSLHSWGRTFTSGALSGFSEGWASKGSAWRSVSYCSRYTR